MRHMLLLLPLLVACAKGETPQADTAAAAPMALTEADVSGTWTGTNMPEGSDSVIARWTQVCANGTCLGTVEGMPDTVRSTYMLMGDSVMGTASPFTSMAGVRVTDAWTVHFSGDNATGTGVMRLADNPDSVVMRYHFQGSRTMQ